MSDRMLAWLWSGGLFIALVLWVPFMDFLRRLASRRAAARELAARERIKVSICGGQPDGTAK
jgi:hypothetical protein